MNDYDDIINLPHYEPRHHSRMPMWNRAAQFAPFAALTGYEAVIQETGRLTDEWVAPGEYGNDELNRKMALLLDRLPEHPRVVIEYFQPDARKEGGAYKTCTGRVRLVDENERFLELQGGRKIPIDFISSMVIMEK